jgi:hypothetical protein
MASLADVPEGTYNVAISGDLSFTKDGIAGSSKINQKSGCSSEGRFQPWPQRGNALFPSAVRATVRKRLRIHCPPNLP